MFPINWVLVANSQYNTKNKRNVKDAKRKKLDYHITMASRLDLDYLTLNKEVRRKMEKWIIIDYHLEAVQLTTMKNGIE